MKIATLNLFQFAEPGYYWYERREVNTYRQEHWRSKLLWLESQLKNVDADIVGFQEVFSVAPLRALAERCGYEYFTTVETPDVDPNDGRVFKKPVVALASRHPFKNVDTIEPETVILEDLEQPDFQFRRLPIKATIQTPDAGDLTLYVVHLKSRRPPRSAHPFNDNTPWRTRAQETLKQHCRGNILALYQSGLEASLIYHDAVNQLSNHVDQAVVVMGDFNNHPEDAALDVLTMREPIFEIAGVPAKSWPKGVKALLHDHRLADSYHIAPNMKNRPRPPTYVHFGEGGVLDFILVSNALNPENPGSKMQVERYDVFNEHLNSDGVADRQQSDHGLVAITLRSSQDIQAQQPTTSGIINPINRQTFVDMAGGVFQNRRSYNGWSSSDKWDNFWSFFFDSDFGWVRSIYGTIPVTELFQRRHHTIEHVVPRSFLDDYLRHKNVPRNVRYGATVNPFNLVPAERDLNSGRSNFMFDLEGDQVVRPFRIHLNPDAYASTGLDAENEWVIPSRTRGDIARAILYMVLVYDIDELYTSHVETLVHWAKIDSPSSWELAYNRWVHARLGIRNPFIDTPDNALKLLDSVVDMGIISDY